MPQDMENLESVADVENFDPSKADRGDSIETPSSAQDQDAEKLDAVEKQAEDDLKEIVKDGEKSDENTPADEKKDDEQPRDEKGRFSDKEPKIPKHRFDEAVNKERAAREAAESRLAALERQIADNTRQAEQDTQVEDLEAKADELTKQHAKLLIDGDDVKASEVMREIRKLDREIVRIEQAGASQKQTAATLESERVNLAIAQLEADHPVLNPDSEEFDESLSAFVLSEQKRLMKVEGLSPSKALVKAGTTIIERFSKRDAAPDEDNKPGLKPQKDLKKESVERNLDASKRQPSSMKDAGVDSDKKGATSALPDVTRITQEEFDALPESTKARMRGDFL